MPDFLTGLRMYQSVKVEAIAAIQDSMVAGRAYEAERQSLPVLTLLASFTWYTKLLFSTASHLDRRDMPFFDALCGFVAYHQHPFDTGQAVFSMAHLWPRPNRCPAVDDSVSMDMRTILRHFSVPSEQVLRNIVTARAPGYRPKTGRQAGPVGELDDLLEGVQGPLLPLSNVLERRGILPPITRSIGCLNNLSADEVVEKLFLATGRVLWHRLPVVKGSTGELANLSPGHNALDVRDTWGMEKFRVLNVGNILRYFLRSTVEELPKRNTHSVWKRQFEACFGTVTDGAWTPVPEEDWMAKQPPHKSWLAVMSKQTAVHQLVMYNLLSRKFDTLAAFPKIDRRKGWGRTRGDSSIILIYNPQKISLGASSGYSL